MHDENLILDVLQQALALWPRTPGALSPALRERLTGILSTTFDGYDFHNIATHGFECISSPDIKGSVATVLLRDSEMPELPHMATLVKEAETWRVQSLKFQCLGCFGSGVNDLGTPCELCGGSGWGASGP